MGSAELTVVASWNSQKHFNSSYTLFCHTQKMALTGHCEKAVRDCSPSSYNDRYHLHFVHRPRVMFKGRVAINPKLVTMTTDTLFTLNPGFKQIRLLTARSRCINNNNDSIVINISVATVLI